MDTQTFLNKEELERFKTQLMTDLIIAIRDEAEQLQEIRDQAESQALLNYIWFWGGGWRE